MPQLQMLKLLSWQSDPRSVRNYSGDWTIPKSSSIWFAGFLGEAMGRGTSMKEYAGRVLMLVENSFPGDLRVRNEASTLTANGFQVSVIALRGRTELPRERVNGI